jgi:hypothetical protein
LDSVYFSSHLTSGAVVEIPNNLNLAQDNQEALQLFCLRNAGKFYLFLHISFERQGTNASCFSSFTLSFDEVYCLL